MKTIVLALTLLLLPACGALQGAQAGPNPVTLLSILTQVAQARAATSAELKALRTAAPAAFDAADKNADGVLAPRELFRYLQEGKLEARAAFLASLRQQSAALRLRGDALSVGLADRIDLVLVDADAWLLVIDLFERP